MVFGDAVSIPTPCRGRGASRTSRRRRSSSASDLIAHLDDAKALTGRTLPGPLPADDADDPDPATGVTDQEAM